MRAENASGLPRLAGLSRLAVAPARRARHPVEPQANKGSEVGAHPSGCGPTSHILPCIQVQFCRCKCASPDATLSL